LYEAGVYLYQSTDMFALGAFSLPGLASWLDKAGNNTAGLLKSIPAYWKTALVRITQNNISYVGRRSYIGLYEPADNN
jgi:hypothetical protein